MKASPIQTSFNAGEFGPELDGRVDIGKYANACRRMENFFPLVQGPARRRGGTKFVAEVKDSADRTWLARFEFNTEQAYILEFGDQYIRFFTDNGALLAPAGSAWATPVVYAVGAVVTNGGNKYYCKTAHTSGATFAGDAAYWYQLPAGGQYEIPAPWAVADITNADGTLALRMVQSGDVLYVCHPDYAPRKLLRNGATDWSIEAVETVGGPFEDTDPDETVTVYASAATGTGVTLTASSATFASTDVGRLFYLEQKKANAINAWEAGKSVTTNDLRRSDGKTYKALNTATTGGVKPIHSSGSEYDGGVQWEFQDPGYGWVEITGYTSTTVVTCTVLSRLPDQVVLVGNATTRWAFGAWGSVAGYPSHVTFFRERLVFARALDRKLWFSVSGDYENFKDRDSGGQVTADMAVSIEVQSDQANSIQYLMPTDALIIGTAGGEHICRELTDTEPFGPANVTIDKSSEYGSRSVQPVHVGESILFVQRSGRKLREITFDALQDGYKTTDVSVLAPHLVPKGKALVHLAYQKEPHSIVWGVRSDGLLLGFTFNREQDVTGWHRHPVGGEFGSGDAVVESIEVVPSPNNDRDDLWLIVKRTVDGGTVRYVEFMQAEWETGDDQEDAFYVDCGLTYDSTAATTISGLDHLEGETVDILADGASHPQKTVTSGAVTLDRSASVVHIGLPCPAKLATMRLNSGAADGTAQGKTKRINRVAVRLLDTLGGEMGPSESETDELLFRSSGDPMDAGPPIFTGDKSVAWRGGYETDAIVWYVNEQPLPATVVAIMPSVVTQDR